MNLHNLHDAVMIRAAIAPAAAVVDNTPWVSNIIDMQTYESMEFAINIGALADADATFTVLVQEGEVANLSDATAVADDDLLGTEVAAGFTFADDNTTRKIGYRGAKRYVRLTITPANNTGSAFISALALMFPGTHYPVIGT